MARGDPAEIAGSNRQAARERALRILAGTMAALFLAFASLGAALIWYDLSNQAVTHTHQVRNAIANTLQALTDAESAQRGYVLTGQPTFLIRVDSAKGVVRTSLKEVRVLTRDNPSQQARLATLGDLIDRRLLVIDASMRLRRESGDAVAAVRVIQQGDGVRAMDGIRRLVAELDTEEAQLEDRRAQRVAIVRGVMIGALIVFAILLAALFVKALRDINLDREVEADTSERLRTLLAERTLLLDEVNHRVKNSLQQIASVVRLQARASRHEEARDALEKTLDRIMAVGRVHEQLYKSTGEVGVFDAGTYATALAHDLVNSMGREDVELVTEVEPLTLDLRQAVPLALILNELVTNALKYGCPTDRPARIRVGLKTEGEAYRLSVSDNGDGLPKGFTPGSTKSLGMRAIEALARQLGGRFVVEQPDSGAAFAVVFPRS